MPIIKRIPQRSAPSCLGKNRMDNTCRSCNQKSECAELFELIPTNTTAEQEGFYFKPQANASLITEKDALDTIMKIVREAGQRAIMYSVPSRKKWTTAISKGLAYCEENGIPWETWVKAQVKYTSYQVANHRRGSTDAGFFNCGKGAIKRFTEYQSRNRKVHGDGRVNEDDYNPWLAAEVHFGKLRVQSLYAEFFQGVKSKSDSFIADQVQSVSPDFYKESPAREAVRSRALKIVLEGVQFGLSTRVYLEGEWNWTQVAEFIIELFESVAEEYLHEEVLHDWEELNLGHIRSIS